MKKILVSIGISLTIGAVAATALASSRLKINAIEVSAGGSTPAVAIQFTTTPDLRPACANGFNSGTVSLDPNLSPDTTKAVTALATSAFLAGKSVVVFYSPNCNPGTNQPLINDIVVTN